MWSQKQKGESAAKNKVTLMCKPLMQPFVACAAAISAH
jgi:hypothetical protein